MTTRPIILACLVMAAVAMIAPARAADLARVCELIDVHARANGLVPDFFARLIWKESRFDANAVSPRNAEGIAQFIPSTAAARGLKDSFDIEQALPASAAYLGELVRRFGNAGLAAAAYNAGETRVGRWLRSGGFLPIETENYVLDILGEPVDAFSGRTEPVTVRPLDGEKPFREACAALPVSAASVPAMASVPLQPWGVQVAGNFRRSAAIRIGERVRGRHVDVLRDHEPVVSRVRSPMGRAGVYVVRFGAESRAEALRICNALRREKAPCLVARNR